jgi:tetratricopeptide (TPR) repeat protein
MKLLKNLGSLISLLFTLSGVAIILVKCRMIPTIRIPVTESSYINISKEESSVRDKNKDRLNNASNANNMGLLKEFEGDKKSALAYYNQAVTLDSSNDIHYSNRGMFFANSGDFKRALSDYNTAIKINSINSVTYDNRGSLKARIGDTKGALSDYNTAIKIDQGFLTAYKNRSKLYEKMGDKKNAINDLKEMAKIYKLNGQKAEYQKVFQYIGNMN